MSPGKATAKRAERELWPSEIAVAEAVGRLMEFWGFKRNMGRVWSVLYLSDRPLAARELKEGLGASVGTVSMTLTELGRWGVVRQVWQKGSRSRLYEAETDLWKMITRVLRERERAEVEHALRDFDDALDHARKRAKSRDPAERVRAEVQQQRIDALLKLGRFGRSLLDAVVTTGRVDLSPLARFLRRR
ncbi:MAG: ArsR family transcriptional regulator [Deltaproteobacteria bacterium]|jgi:DNA-binding transcriptional regulator GbsR (MarR family)|nr:ArsR family transcriptional regulator [Deltaproteobacteria bacterium]MBW2533298.1 ArsR family transcriptional regulator [Deltaproteobacteria bacterium]